MKLTVADLLACKGQRQLTEVLTTDPDEARACQEAGIDMLVSPQQFTRQIAEAAPDTFLIAGLGINDPDIVTPADAIRASFRAMSDGADAIYTGLSLPVVAAMANESIPVVGHVGYVPYRSGFFGGARAVGKTAAEAQQVFDATRAYEDAGAIAVEMEIVPEKVAAEISRRVALLVISMGSGNGCDAQYLFACDILGTNTGHLPRHAKKYADLAAEMARIQEMRVDAFERFRQDVERGSFPGDQHSIRDDGEQLAMFVAALDRADD